MSQPPKRGRKPLAPLARLERAERALSYLYEIQEEAKRLRLDRRAGRPNSGRLDAVAIVAERHGMKPDAIERFIERHCDTVVNRKVANSFIVKRARSPFAR